MSASTRSLAAHEISGPTSVVFDAPSPTDIFFARSTSSGIHRRASPTSTATDTAMQRWPAAPNDAPASASSVCCRCASGRTMAWFFAPIMHCTRLPASEARWYTCVPTLVEPTNEIARMSGWSQIAFTTASAPCTTLSTPAGTPASSASSHRRIVTIGSCSEGLSTKVLPQAIAIGNIHSGIIAGKLNGVMPAHTPRGCSSVYVSTPLATLLASSPSCRLPMLAACSTTSSPRNTSPSASASVLPCSAVRRAASSFMFSRINCWYFRKMRARAPMGVLRQILNAFAAAATAASTSSAVASGTRASTACVAGLTTSRH